MANLFLVKNAVAHKHAHVSEHELNAMNDLCALLKNVECVDTSSDFDKDFWSDDASNFAKAFAQLSVKSSEKVCEHSVSFEKLHAVLQE